MNVEIVVSIIGLIGTIITVITGNRLTAYRIEQLEKKQDKHNCLMERMYEREKHDAVVDEEIKVINHRLSDLERDEK